MRSTDGVFALAVMVIVVGVATARMLIGGPGEANELLDRRPDPRILQPGDAIPEAIGRRRPLPGSSASDSMFTIKLAQKVSSTGTAFAVDAEGHWLTARHVVDGCTKITLVHDGMQAAKTNAHHQNADLSLLLGKAAPVGLRVARRRLEGGQDGFHVGFPQGEPGAVHSKLLGRRQMRLRGRYRTSEPVIAWVEQRRLPSGRSRLRGISGGPVLDRTGEVIGATLAVSARRGRIYSTDPATIREFAKDHGVGQDHTPQSTRRIDADTLWNSSTLR